MHGLPVDFLFFLYQYIVKTIDIARTIAINDKPNGAFDHDINFKHDTVK